MIDTRILLAAVWICLMLTYLLGDVLRIFSGDFKPGEIMDKKATQTMWFAAAIIMLVPIIMILLSLILPYESNRILNIIAAAFLGVFNLSSILTYPSFYDRFLIGVGVVFNLITIIYAFQWII